MLGSFILIEMFKKLTSTSTLVKYPVTEIIMSITLVFLIIYVVTKYSIKRIKKQNIIETIRKENI